MLFYLTTLNLMWFMTEHACFYHSEEENDFYKCAALESLSINDFFCRNYNFNGLKNTLYNEYG